jgi:hypothetical protein
MFATASAASVAVTNLRLFDFLRLVESIFYDRVNAVCRDTWNSTIYPPLEF